MVHQCDGNMKGITRSQTVSAALANLLRECKVIAPDL